MGEIKKLIFRENRPSWTDIKHSAIRYKKFPLIDSWSGLLNAASLQLPVILFTAIFSPAVAGFYSLSHRTLSLPMSLIGGSVANVFMERAAKAKNNNEELGRITLKLYKKLIFIGSILMSFITFYGDRLFPFIFGEQWTEAGKYAQWISVWLVFQFAYSPISIIYALKERQLEGLLINLILLSTRVAFVIPYILGFVDIYAILAIYSISSLLFYLSVSYRIFFIVKMNSFAFIKTLIIYFFIPYAFQGLIFGIINNFIK